VLVYQSGSLSGNGSGTNDVGVDFLTSRAAPEKGRIEDCSLVRIYTYIFISLNVFGESYSSFTYGVFYYKLEVF
jgi:hypothetical protein